MPYINTEIFILALTGIIVILTLWVVRLEVRIHNLLRGSDNKSLEGSIRNLQKENDSLKAFRQEIESYLKNVEQRLRKTISGVHIVRFNPFKGTGVGGDQSFATAFTNEEGNGVVISTMHSRDHVGVFSKPVKNGTSEYELTKEEKESIDTALAMSSGKSD